MNRDLERIINKFLKILGSKSTQFNNIAKIEGLNNKSIEISATVISKQFSKRMDLYRNLLEEAIDDDEKFNPESIRVMDTFLSDYETTRRALTFTDVKQVVDYALQCSQIYTIVFDKLLELLDSDENDRRKLIKLTSEMKLVEEKNMQTLKSFIKE